MPNDQTADQTADHMGAQTTHYKKFGDQETRARATAMKPGDQK